MPPTLLLSGFPVLIRAHDDIRQTDDGLTRLPRTTDWGIEGGQRIMDAAHSQILDDRNLLYELLCQPKEASAQGPCTR